LNSGLGRHNRNDAPGLLLDDEDLIADNQVLFVFE
jgi:hypothetical protein